MVIYIIFFVLNMLFGLLLSTRNGVYKPNELKTNNRRKKAYLIFTTLQFGILCGLRSTKMGWDTASYKFIFDVSPDSWSRLFEDSTYVETGFSALCGLVKLFGGNYQTLLLITSLFSLGSCCLFIYRYSNSPMLSVFTILSFPFYYSSYDVVRHFIAIGFLLIAYKYIEEEKFIKYVVTLLIGSLFHVVALTFLPLYFVKKVRWNAITGIVAAGCTAILYFFLYPAIALIGRLIGKSPDSLVEQGFLDVDAGGTKTAIMYVAILLIAIIAYRSLKNRTAKDNRYVNYILLIAIFSIISTNARIAIRMIMAMVPFMAIAMPELLDSRRATNVATMGALRFGYITIGLIYHAFMLITNWSGIIPYTPYWM